MDFGVEVYEEWKNTVQTIDDFTNETVRFSEQVEKTFQEIQTQVLFVTNQISKIYEVQQNLFLALDNVASGAGAFTRLLAWNTIGDIINYTGRLQGDFKDYGNSVEKEGVSSIRDTYFSKEGDTLQGISTKFYNTPDRWQELKDINLLGDGLLPPDSFLIIPV